MEKLNQKTKINLQLFADAAQTNRNIIKQSILTTGSYGANALLAPRDAEKFIDMIQENSSFLGQMDFEVVDRKSGTISKLGVGSRLLRSHTEGNDDISGNEVVPVIGSVNYDCKDVCLGTSITEEWLKRNKEKERFEQHFMSQIASQISVDILDLAFNGDEATATSSSEYGFLKLNDGFIKQVKNAGNIVDGATIDGGKFSKKMFYALRRATPKKYRTNKFKWICSDDTYTDLCEYLSDRTTALGDIAINKADGAIEILGTSFETIPNLADDIIIYADPDNFKVVYFGEIVHRKTVEGKEAIYQQKRFYATHLSIDYIIKEIESIAMLINRGALV